MRCLFFLFICIMSSFSLINATKITQGYIPSETTELEKTPFTFSRNIRFQNISDSKEIFVYEEAPLHRSREESVLIHSGDDIEVDKRVIVDPSKSPHWIHALVKSDLDLKTDCYGITHHFFIRGSATLISPHCLVTAAHCVFHKGKHLTPEIYFGIDNDDSPAGYLLKVVAAEISIHPEYLRNKDPHYDIAIIRINEDLPGNTFGYGALSSYDSSDVQGLVNDIHTVTGYPSRYKGQVTFRMLTDNGPIIRFDHKDKVAHMIYYEIDTSPGQSGSGICKIDGALNEVIGVHTTGKKVSCWGCRREELNSGVFFNVEKILSFLLETLTKMDSDWATFHLETIPNSGAVS